MTPPEPAVALLDAIETILRLPPDRISLDATLADLGADSVDQVEILAHTLDLLDHGHRPLPAVTRDMALREVVAWIARG